MGDELKIEYIPIEKIKPNEYNPKQITDMEMLENVGFTEEELAPYSNFDTEDEELKKEREEVGGEFITESIEFMKKDHELFIKIMDKIKVDYKTTVKSLQYGLKLGKVLEKYESVTG